LAQTKVSSCREGDGEGDLQSAPGDQRPE
jgi:hypothetical protein